MQNPGKDRNERARNIADVKGDLELQQSDGSGLSPNITDSDAGSFNAVNRNNEQNQKTDWDAKDNLMPNPDDFDEGDDEDSGGKGRTPGL